MARGYHPVGVLLAENVGDARQHDVQHVLPAGPGNPRQEAPLAMATVHEVIVELWDPFGQVLVGLGDRDMRQLVGIIHVGSLDGMLEGADGAAYPVHVARRHVVFPQKDQPVVHEEAARCCCETEALNVGAWLADDHGR